MVYRTATAMGIWTLGPLGATVVAPDNEPVSIHCSDNNWEAEDVSRANALQDMDESQQRANTVPIVVWGAPRPD